MGLEAQQAELEDGEEADRPGADDHRVGDDTIFTHLRPSSPFTSAVVRPPMRGSGRPASVTATATTISPRRGASATRSSMPQKWMRTLAASLWPRGTTQHESASCRKTVCQH